jgi:hypothetical protein
LAVFGHRHRAAEDVRGIPMSRRHRSLTRSELFDRIEAMGESDIRAGRSSDRELVGAPLMVSWYSPALARTAAVRYWPNSDQWLVEAWTAGGAARSSGLVPPGRRAEVVRRAVEWIQGRRNSPFGDGTGAQ